MERTLVILKPDCVQRQLVGEVLTRFEKTGLKIIAIKMTIASKHMLKEHYSDDLIPIVGGKTISDWDKYGIKHNNDPNTVGKKIVEATRAFLGSGPVIALVLEGGHAVEIVRKLIGSTGPKDSMPGTIRGDYAHLSLGQASAKGTGAYNLIHASGSLEEAKQEIKLWFDDQEIFSYKTVHEIYTHV